MGQKALQATVRKDRRVVHIRDLPADILLDLLSLVPSRDLVCNCRLVCSQWRELVDAAALWKRKSQREGYLPPGQDGNIPDWRTFYFLCTLKRNLIKNPVAEAGFNYWNLDSNKRDKWKIEEQLGADGQVQKVFVTSYRLCMKHQLINLKEEGYWDELMDQTKPDIMVKDWYAARNDCDCRYKLDVRLLSASQVVLEQFNFPDEVLEQWNDAQWHEVSHTFHNYPPGVRYIYFRHGRQDTLFWVRWYGIQVTKSSITIGPEVAS